MRIVFSLTNLELGGAQMFVLRLARELSRRPGVQVAIYDHAPESRHRELVAHFSDRVHIHSISERSMVRFLIWKINALLLRLGSDFRFRNWLNEVRFKGFLRRYQPYVVSSHMRHSDRIVARNRSAFNGKFVITSHGEYELFHGYGAQELPISLDILRQADGFVYITQKNLEAVREFTGQLTYTRFRNISIGFSPEDMPRYDVDRTSLGIPDDAFVVGMIARAIPEKGWDVAIEAVRKLRREFPRLHLVLIGLGDYLRSLVGQGESGIHLVQHEEQPLFGYSYIRLFDLGLLPTSFPGESVPNSVIEYLSWGKPVVASRIGEIPQMIREKEAPAGTVIDYRAGHPISVEELAQAIRQYLIDPGLLAHHAANAPAAFRAFSLAGVADAYLDFFRELLSGNRQSPA
jgi:glycosyltransferase involved in cell wall biosynthesis